jgi:hypothetical protein
MVKVASAPAAGQYSVDGTGTYTFNSADASKSIQIRYIKYAAATSPLAQSGFTLFDGSQTAGWGYLTSKHPGQDLVHRFLAKVANSKIDLGESGQMPNFQWEVAGLLLYPGQLDSNPKDIINFLLTDPVFGAQFPSANLDALTQYSNWCVANGLFLSPTYEAQRTFAECVQELCDITNAAPFDSEGKLKIVPYGDKTVLGNGVTYTPPAPIYDLTRDDFIADPGTPPIDVIPISKQDIWNSVSVEYLNRASDYNPDVVPESDAAQIELYGLRKQDPVKYHAITQKTVAALVANMMLNKQTRDHFVYKFKLGVQYDLLEPMDLSTITLAELAYNKKPVRFTSITENDDRTFDMEAVDFPYASATGTLYPKGEGAGSETNNNNDPGDVTTPFIYEPPARATQDGLGNEVWVGTYGASADWGGADVWLSNDNNNYRLVGSIPGKVRSGITASTLAAAADPDTTHTVDVDLSTSGGALINATATDCDNFRSMMLLNNELISFQDVTLLGANQYRLGTRLRRGVYGTPIASHALSERAVRIDDNILKLKFKAEDVGQQFYLKFTSYNTFGRAEQQVANVTAYTFTLLGSNGGNDFVPTELVHDALVLEATATGAGTLSVQIANTAYTIVAGDKLEYDIWIDPSSADAKAGVDIVFGDATTLRGNGYRDQVPLSADPTTDLSAYANAKWFHRKIDISRAAGKVTAQWLVGFDGSAVGYHRAKFANIRIMNGTTVKAIGWSTGIPAFALVNTNTNFTIGSHPLYSQNDNGQWYGLLIQGSSAGLNQQGSTIPYAATGTPFTYGTGGTGLPYIKWTWGAITVYRPDGTTFTIASSASMYNMVPPTPTLSQVAGGAKAAATQRVRIAYMKGDLIVAVGPETSLAVLINNVLKITSPAAVAGLRWMDAAGGKRRGRGVSADCSFQWDPVWNRLHRADCRRALPHHARNRCDAVLRRCHGCEHFQWLHLGAQRCCDFTRAALQHDLSFLPNILQHSKFVYMPGGCFTGSGAINQPALQAMFSDNCTPLAGGTGMTGITPAASGGSGGGGGGGCPKKGHHIFAERGKVFGTPYKNKYWVLIRTEEGGVFQVVPRHRWTTKRGLVCAQDLNSESSGPDFLWVKMRATGEKKWLRVLSADPHLEEAEAEGVVVEQEDKLYFCGAPESTCDAEGHNLKPS